MKQLPNNRYSSYTIIRRNKETNSIEIIESNSTKELKKKLEKKEYFRKLNKMINNWNNFRDTDIQLRGDMSFYFNYREEINKIIREDLEYEEMKEIKNNDKDDYSSDEENNKYLLY